MNWNRNRRVRERWFIVGQLELATPTSLSNGDDDPLVDLPVVVDALEGRPLLTGASLAGALRSYLVDFDPHYAKALFGGNRGQQQDDDTQSPLIVEDALGNELRIELREGVSIEPASRTAKEDEQYDRQLLSAGTVFELGFELVVAEDADGKTLREALAQALDGLQQGDIRLGGRKRRGYGQCRVTGWQAWRYDLGRPEGVRGWLAHDHQKLPGRQKAHWTWRHADGGEGIRQWDALQDAGPLPRPNGPFTLSATFDVDGAVLIRSGFEAETGPDVAHLRSRRGGTNVPVMSGTSLAGIIRAQALRIARTMAGAEPQHADALVNAMFGYMAKPERGMSAKERRELPKHASRVTVDESEITGPPKDIVQTRVKIDRFTGGAFESALFAEQPAFGGQFELRLSLRRPTVEALQLPPDNLSQKEIEKLTEAEIEALLERRMKPEVGLLLLVLKDLWTGFLPVGGSSSVGRGRLKGRRATISYAEDKWTLTEPAGGPFALSPGGQKAIQTLNSFVTAFKNQMEGKADGNR